MKNKLLKFLFVLIIIPVIVFTGCKKNNPLPAIDLNTYLNDKISITNYQIETPSQNDLSLITSSKLNKKNLGKYLTIELTANSVWMYKMFIESISFYVYTTKSSDLEMIVSLSVTNMADEETLKKITSEAPTTDTVNETCSFLPKKGKTTKCTFNINKAIAKATGSTITIDISNSVELFNTEDGTPAFEWAIYGFEIHGESRAYSK